MAADLVKSKAMVRASSLGRRWLIVLVSGLALWLAGAAAIAVSSNTLILPTVLFLGTFLGPITLAVWAFEMDRPTWIGPDRVLAALVLGGGLSFLGAAVIETPLDFTGSVPVNAGLVEELLKLLMVAVVAIGIRRFAVRDGMLLGAAVGLGFAALESSGYALRSYYTSAELSQLLATELTRNLIAPVTHGLWTAIAGGLLFAVAGGGLRRIFRVPALLGGYLVVAALHTYWDSTAKVSHQLAAAVVQITADPGAIVLTWDGVWLAMVGLGSLLGLALLLLLAGASRKEGGSTSPPRFGPTRSAASARS